MRKSGIEIFDGPTGESTKRDVVSATPEMA